MPQACTLIRTDPGPGSGIGRSTSSRGPPGRETWATRIVALNSDTGIGRNAAGARERMFISVSCGVPVGVTVSPGLLFVPLGNGHLLGVRPRRRVTRGAPPRAQVGWFSWTVLREFEVRPNGYEPRSLFVALLRDRDLFGVAGVQDHREEAHLRRLARVPRHPVDAAGRLVERIPGLVGLDRLVVEGVLVFALQDVAEHRAGMVVR